MSLEFHAPTGRYTVSPNDIDHAARSFLHAIRQVREMNGLPLTPYEHTALLTPADHAQKSIIDGAKTLGIDLGGLWGNEIDVSKVN